MKRKNQIYKTKRDDESSKTPIQIATIQPKLYIVDHKHLDSEKTFCLDSANFTTLKNSISEAPHRY